MAELEQALLPLGGQPRVRVSAEEDSTNATLLQWGREGHTSPCLLVAKHQRAGRGRSGRSWHSAPGDSLTFSLGLPYEPADWSGLSLAVGLALAEALDTGEPAGRPGEAYSPAQPAFAPVRLGLKWPNDLWLVEGGEGGPGGGRKLGGILIETCPQGRTRWCVVGVGLNIRPHAFEGLASGYACLQELDPAASAPQALLRVAGPLARALARFAAEGFAPLQAAYARRDLLCGRWVGTSGPQARQGLATGVDAQGALRLREADGPEHTIVAGEVSVRPLGRSEQPCVRC